MIGISCLSVTEFVSFLVLSARGLRLVMRGLRTGSRSWSCASSFKVSLICIWQSLFDRLGGSMSSNYRFYSIV